MAVTTVRGPVRREDLGIVLPHEHVFLDLTCQFTEPADPEGRERAHRQVAREHAPLLFRNPYAMRDNLVIGEVALAVEELSLFRDLGGRTVVDCTSYGLCPVPEKLREVAEQTDLHVIAGTGYYVQATHPPEMPEWSVEAIAETLARDLVEGFAGTGMRAGVIGEIGTSDPIHPEEAKNLRAAALAHGETDAPIQVHTYPWGQRGLEALRLLEEGGVDPGRVVICHTDVAPDLEYMRALLKRGAFVQFDDFGKEFPVEGASDFAGGPFATDEERVAALCRLVELGYERRLLLTNDICFKSLLHRYGGQGYGHVLRSIVPRLREAGLPASTLELLLAENPAQWLDPV